MEHITNYTNRVFASKDLNRNGVLELTAIPFVSNYPEVGQGWGGDFFRKSAAFGNPFVVDRYSLQNAVYRDVDLNHDQWISIPEKLWAFITKGLW